MLMGLTTKRILCVIVFAKANAKPAMAAVTPGVISTLTAVSPTTTADRRLNRASTNKLEAELESTFLTGEPSVDSPADKSARFTSTNSAPRPNESEQIRVCELHHVLE